MATRSARDFRRGDRVAVETEGAPPITGFVMATGPAGDIVWVLRDDKAQRWQPYWSDRSAWRPCRPEALRPAA